MMVIRREGAAHDGAGGGQVDRKLARDRAMLDIGDAFRREKGGEDVAVLAGFACSQRRERPDRKAEVEGDAVKVPRADAGARQNEQAMLLHQLAQFVDDRKDRLGAAIHDRAAADLYDLQPGQQPDRTPARDRPGQIGIEQRLAGKRRSDVLGRGFGFGHGRRLTSR